MYVAHVLVDIRDMEDPEDCLVAILPGVIQFQVILFFTARCYADRGDATVVVCLSVCPSVCDVEVCFSHFEILRK